MPKTYQIIIEKRGAVTNGDVIKAMFPNIRIIEMPEVEVVEVHDGLLGESRNFSWGWWNSPYKPESEEEE